MPDDVICQFAYYFATLSIFEEDKPVQFSSSCADLLANAYGVIALKSPMLWVEMAIVATLSFSYGSLHEASFFN